MKKIKYPKVTTGSKIAAKCRKQSNKFTAEQRRILFEKGMKIVNVGSLP